MSIAPQAIRRQQRGERRIATLLDAAAAVFAEQGYDKATTNAVALRAKVSPGTLYQFFASKEALAEALVTAWSPEVTAAHDRAFALDAVAWPVHRIVDRVADTLIALHQARPALRVLLHGSEGPPALAALSKPLHDAVLLRVARLITARSPERTAREASIVAAVVVQQFKGLLPLVLGAPPRQRAAFDAELRRAMTGYLGALEAKR